MQSKKGTFFSEYSSIVTFTTPAPEVIVCGTKPASLLGSQVPYLGAMSGDKIKIDGFELVLDSLAEGEGGYYGGDGLIAAEFLGGKQFEVYFERLFINEQAQEVVVNFIK